MIKAQELRIGNKILSCFKNIETVRSVLGHQNAEEYHETYKHLICVKENGNQYSLGEINPIPLTPELLEKCGFVKCDSHFGGWIINIAEDESIRIKKYENLNLWVWPLFGNVPVICNYLHQLQNLYFALTGTELEVNL